MCVLFFIQNKTMSGDLRCHRNTRLTSGPVASWQLAARGMTVSTAAGGNTAEAAGPPSTSRSPPPECSPPPPQEPAPRAPVLPVPQLQTNPAVSMTAALKNVGAVSTRLHSREHPLGSFLIPVFLCRILFFLFLQITPMKESLPDLERVQVSERQKKKKKPGCFTSQTVVIQGSWSHAGTSAFLSKQPPTAGG